MLSVKTNLLAANADRQLRTNTKKNAKLAEKLSSGYRINRAADDAAGLAISEKMRRQIRGLHQSVDNINDGIGYVQTAEGALNEVHDMLQRINELAVKSANGTNTEEDRSYIDSEVQAIKNEMDRIFETTSFNEQRIWEPDELKLLGYDKRPAVTFLGSDYTNHDVTNSNYGVFASAGYTIQVVQTDPANPGTATELTDFTGTLDPDNLGVRVTWKGYDGKDYKTEVIPWKTLEGNNYSFEMSDYFGAKTADNKLYTTNAVGGFVPQFTNKVSFSVEDTATLEDILSSISGASMGSSPSTDLSGVFQDTSNDYSSLGVSVNNSSGYTYLAYLAACASKETDKTNGHNFDAGDDPFIEPTNNTANMTANPISAGMALDDARQSDKTWQFKFDMKGIGSVTATSTGVTYYSNDQDRDDYDFWWYTDRYGQNWQLPKSSDEHGGGSLGSVMAALTGGKDDTSPGLLSKANGGVSDSGGWIYLRFSMQADKPFDYGDNKGETNVGQFTIRINVSNTDTEQSVLDKIGNALNSNTEFDLFTSSAGSDNSRIYRPSGNVKILDVPIYGGTCNFFVQAGAEAGQHIDIEYESLSLIAIGLRDTNVLTVEDSDAAINEIKNAMQIVSKQRSDFGAYQNRLEHAVNINQNVEENTQAAESLIRDTDIAEMMMEYSVNNILLQAGTSMLTQANQSKQSVLELLN